MCAALAINAICAEPSRGGPSLAVAPEYLALPDGAKAEDDAVIMVVYVPAQRMYVVSGGKVVRRFSVSTAAAGVGEQENSGCTPRGWHRIVKWIGAGAALGQVFVSRRLERGHVLGKSKWSDDNGGDAVLTRIMWLDGMEPGVNSGGAVDSHSRFIYIHGTNQEHLLGRPVSHGCIRLSNDDVADLFDLTRGHPSYVNIVEF